MEKYNSPTSHTVVRKPRREAAIIAENNGVVHISGAIVTGLAQTTNEATGRAESEPTSGVAPDLRRTRLTLQIMLRQRFEERISEL